MYNNESIREYCLSKPGTTESLPFDDVTLVFKVVNKVFLILSLDTAMPSFNAKCDPDLALEWRERHPQIIPGFHMNKKHWNTIEVDQGLSENFIREIIDHSYGLVVAGLPKKDKAALQHFE